ncbi:hypothetical protein BH23GEM2_BH23GEM2_14900 [soil metagenome]
MAKSTETAVTTRSTEVGVLRQWRRELRAGARTIHNRDPLWRAAVYEAAARDAGREGMHQAAASDLDNAAALIVAALAGGAS